MLIASKSLSGSSFASASPWMIWADISEQYKISNERKDFFGNLSFEVAMEHQSKYHYLIFL